MRNTSSKKTIFLIISLLILFVSVLGVTFAFFYYKRTSATYSQAIAGSLKMNYTEESNGITLVDTLPISDENALAIEDLNNYFDFSVNYDVSTTASIVYSIYLQDVTSSIDEIISGEVQTLDYTRIKVALINTDTSEMVLSPDFFANFNDLTTSGYSVYSNTVSGKGSANYRLYMWIPEIDSNGEVIKLSDITNQNFSLIVNVKASGVVNE